MERHRAGRLLEVWGGKLFIGNTIPSDVLATSASYKRLHLAKIANSGPKFLMPKLRHFTL